MSGDPKVTREATLTRPHRMKSGLFVLVEVHPGTCPVSMPALTSEFRHPDLTNPFWSSYYTVLSSQ